METYSIKVAYNGEQFAGFARQPGQLTVQGELENALRLIFRADIETTCAGRTDSGVHAIGQVVSFDLEDGAMKDRTDHSVLRSLNALTHEDIMVTELERRPDGFSARFDAKMREYRYFIYQNTVPPLFMNNFSWHIANSLNLEAMRQAASFLIGEHDFKSFCMAASAEGRTTNRYVDSIDISNADVLDERMVVVCIRGNAFLHSMVRAIVGTLVAVGKGQRQPSWVKDVLAARDRKAAGENAPAKGLVLWSVEY